MRSKPNIRLLLINLIAIAGIIISILLTQHFYEVRSGLAGFKSFCNISSTVNCDIVAASPFAEFAFGIPLSIFAAGWFVSLLLISALAHSPNFRKEATQFMLLLTLGGTGFSLAYLMVMMFNLKTYCLLCLGVDALNISALALVLSLKPDFSSFGKIRSYHWKTFLGITAGSIFFTLLFLKSLDKMDLPQSKIQEMTLEVVNNSPTAISTGPEHPSIGPKNAPISIVEFSDFQCPSCRMGVSLVNSLYLRYPGKIRIEFRNFPIDPACNPLVNHRGHPVACEAARVALCANKEGKFEEVYQELFSRQKSLVPGEPLKIAKELGLDEAKLKSCMESKETSEILSKDIQEGLRLEINSTPTFYVNQRKMEGVAPVAVWNQIVETLLKK